MCHDAKCYRTVFNAARDMLVAVEESARSTGKGRNSVDSPQINAKLN
ncbi:ESPR-type extended signal peptide-containing protein [Ralstonia solanacearum]|nr:ESPR-type extended signal peptide-containing protein [Ralstonia solanacearum]